MFVRSCTTGFVRTFAPPLSRLAAVVGVAMILGPAAYAQEADAERTARKREPIVFTVDVAEDLAGKFVPTFVKPEHTQPERGSFFVTGGRIFPAGTIDGDGATFDPNRSGHIGIWICRGTHLVAANEIPAAPLWVRHGAAIRARPSGQGAARHGGRRRRRDRHPHRHRRHREFCRLGRRTAADLSRLQPDGWGQPARDVHSAAAREVGARSVHRPGQARRQSAMAI